MTRSFASLLALCVAGCAPNATKLDWRTRAERTHFLETSRYPEVVEYCRQLERCSPWVHLVTMGTTPQGRDMPLLVVSKERAFTPKKAVASGKAVVLIINGIHAGEIEGKEASLALVREIAITQARRDLLDHVILLIVPIFNIDGHERFGSYNRINQNGPREMGWRCTSRNLNLNRDFAKADSVEMRAWLRMYHAWKPHLWFDSHTTDGADYQYDVTFGASSGPENAPSVAKYVNERLHPHLLASLEQDGHAPQLFFELRDRLDPGKGIESNFGFSPRFSTGYGAITNRPSVLIETHMLKPFGVRVKATYNLFVRSLELINRDPAALIDAVRQADEETKAACTSSTRVVLTTTQPTSPEERPIEFKGFAVALKRSEASGGQYPVWDHDKPLNVPSKMFSPTQAAGDVKMPVAYAVPAAWTEVIERLELHGLRIERLSEPLNVEVESYRFKEIKWRERPFEGRHEASYRIEPISEKRMYSTGSVLVRLDQPMAKVAVHLLEPDAPDALVRWGFFDAIFEQKEYFDDYVLAPMADGVLATDESARGEFEVWLASHPAARDNPRARLEYFFEHSPYRDDRKDIYPVGRIMDATLLPRQGAKK